MPHNQAWRRQPIHGRNPGAGRRAAVGHDVGARAGWRPEMPCRSRPAGRRVREIQAPVKMPGYPHEKSTGIL